MSVCSVFAKFQTLSSCSVQCLMTSFIKNCALMGQQDNLAMLVFLHHWGALHTNLPYFILLGMWEIFSLSKDIDCLLCCRYVYLLHEEIKYVLKELTIYA